MMIINPFWAGVGATLLFEALAIIGAVLVAGYRYSKKNRR